MRKVLIMVAVVVTTAQTNAQNIGIGTSTPAHKLDLAGGRMRIQHSAAGTAGIWFDGPTLPQRSFIGTLNDAHVGIFGGGGTGWNFVMNTNNGNTGVGTSAPTATLDVNGTLRIRQNGATAGSSLYAVDAQGNTEWFAPVAFQVKGYSAGSEILFPSATWQDINFGSNTAYNFGSGYSSATSEFTAPQNGLYQFKSQLTFQSNNFLVAQRLKLRRNGVVSIVASSQIQTLDGSVFDFSSQLDTEIVLVAGDQLWIEAYAAAVNGVQVSVMGSGIYTWFSGRMIIPL